MKTIFYSPLIALITLCGCKSNSFMTQRYTHLKHSKQSHTSYVSKTEKKDLVRERVYYSEATATLEEPPTNASPVASVESREIGKAKSIYLLPERRLNPLLFAKTKAATVVKNDAESHQNHQIVGKKSIKEKANHLRGLITLTFKIVILAILLAILVALIILIILI